jgi:DNA-binding transcriptional LysR family regulator
MFLTVYGSMTSGKTRFLMRVISVTDTGPVNMAGLDLNLMVALDALLQERSVTRAAAKLGLSQPALSGSLSRLRRHFGDELLTRSGNDYRLTPLAVQLKERVRIALSGAERVFTAQPDFDPASSTREFTLLVSDYVVVTLGDTIAQTLAREAPHTRLRFSAHSPSVVERADQALLTADLMLLPHGFVADLSHRDLYRDEWVCVVAADNPVAERGLTVQDLHRMPWVVTYHGQTASTPAARQMRMLGIEPTVQVVVEHFLAVPSLVAGSDRIALLQRRLVDLLPLNIGVRALAPPFDVAPLIEAMWWNPVYDHDPEHLYLRDVLIKAARQATGEVDIGAPDTAPRHKWTGSTASACC